MPAMDSQHLADLVADVHDRVERRRRLLEDHGDAVAAELAHLVVGQLQQVAPVELDLAALDPAGRRDEPQDREATSRSCRSPTRRRGP